MVKTVTFYDKDDAIQYRLRMRLQGYVTKIIHPEGKYEVIVAGEDTEAKEPAEWSSFERCL
jgi:hypothetical protein